MARGRDSSSSPKSSEQHRGISLWLSLVKTNPLPPPLALDLPTYLPNYLPRKQAAGSQ